MRSISRSQQLLSLRQVNSILCRSSYVSRSKGVLFRSASTVKNPIDPDRKDSPPGTTFFTANSSYSYKDKDKGASDKFANEQGPSHNPKPIQEDAARPATTLDPRDHRAHEGADQDILRSQPQKADIPQGRGAHPPSSTQPILGPRVDSLESEWDPDQALQHDVSHYGLDRISVMSPNLDEKVKVTQKVEGFVEGYATGSNINALDALELEMKFVDSNQALDSDIQRFFMDRIAHIEQRR